MTKRTHYVGGHTLPTQRPSDFEREWYALQNAPSAKPLLSKNSSTNNDGEGRKPSGTVSGALKCRRRADAGRSEELK
jgi:hypothetical protein